MRYNIHNGRIEANIGGTCSVKNVKGEIFMKKVIEVKINWEEGIWQ